MPARLQRFQTIAQLPLFLFEKKEQKLEVFLFWKPLSQGDLSAERAVDTRDGGEAEIM